LRTGPDWESIVAAAGDADLPVAVGGGLDPVNLLAAYRSGVFPFPTDDARVIEVNQVLYERDVARGRICQLDGGSDERPYRVTWWCPAWRPVIRSGAVRVSRTLARERRRSSLVTTCDVAYAEVLDRCGLRREHRWLTDDLCASLLSLYRQGWAHSIELWQGQSLVAGLVGIGVGQVFSMDTAFTTINNGVKLAICDLDRRLAGTSVDLLDVQVPSGYTEALGASVVTRAHFRSKLRSREPVRLMSGKLDLGQAGADEDGAP
jgi:leucyl/phenylalanyl-tRNA--protein transferase